MRPGGAFTTTMQGPNGEAHFSEGAFLRVVDREALTFTSCFGEDWRPVQTGFAMTAHITLFDEDGKTRYDVLVLHMTPEMRQQHEEMGFHDGWGTCIAQLDEVAQGL